MKGIIPVVILNNFMAESIRVVGDGDKLMPALPRHFQICMNMHWEYQIICHDSVQLHSAEQASVVFTMTPLPPLQTNNFITLDTDKLNKINVSSAGSPVTTVNNTFEKGQRYTLLVWAPNHYQLVSSWTPTSDSFLFVMLKTQSFSGVTLFYSYVVLHLVILNSFFKDTSQLTANKSSIGGWEELILKFF